jgi:hypothetical protein
MNKKYFINKELLKFYYNVCKYTILEISKLIGCNPWVIKNRMKLFKIKIRTTGESIKIRGSNAKENNGFWKGSYTRFPRCKTCRKYLTSYEATYCNEHKGILISKLAVKGKQHHWYIHGEGYKGYSYCFMALRPKIYKRDNYTCQKCNQYGTVGKNILTSHHIDYNKEHNQESNLITLCQSCNAQVNKDRNYWFAYFTYLMENK